MPGWLDTSLQQFLSESTRLRQTGDALLNHLPLVVHPAAELLSEAMQRRREGLDQLWCDAQRLIAIGDPVPWHLRPRRRWLLLASDDLPQCFLYRVEQKRQQLEPGLRRPGGVAGRSGGPVLERSPALG